MQGRVSSKPGRACSAAVLAGVLAIAIFAPAAANGEGKIVFTSHRDGPPDIYSMEADGTQQARLTVDSTSSSIQPSWSPGAERIAFSSDRDGDPGIYSMNADGSDQTPITTGAFWDTEPAWSPQGDKIAFTRGIWAAQEIYVMNVDGSGQTQLTSNGAMDHEPTWSPDGSKIAFATDRDGDVEVYVMNADGSNPTRLTDNSAPDDDFLPDWSPDGTKIAFTSDRDGDHNEIYSMNADGSAQTRLTNNGASDGSPSWSPDGTKIAFDSSGQLNPETNSEIWVMAADGSNPTNLTSSAGYDNSPDWQPAALPSPAAQAPSRPPSPEAGVLATGVATPEIAALSLRRRFAVSRKATPIRLAAAASAARTRRKHSVRRGTSIRFTLSKDAVVRFSIFKRARRSRKARSSRRSGSSSKRYRLQGELERRGAQGKNRVAFSGRIGALRLSPGLHRLVAVATDGDGHVSAPVERYFRIVSGR